MLDIIDLPLLTMQGNPCSHHPKIVFTGKDIAATNIRSKSTIYCIIKNIKERDPIVVNKVSGYPSKYNKLEAPRFLNVIQLRRRGTTSAGHAQEWQQVGFSLSASTVRRRC